VRVGFPNKPSGETPSGGTASNSSLLPLATPEPIQGHELSPSPLPGVARHPPPSPSSRLPPLGTPAAVDKAPGEGHELGVPGSSRPPPTPPCYSPTTLPWSSKEGLGATSNSECYSVPSSRLPPLGTPAAVDKAPDEGPELGYEKGQ